MRVHGNVSVATRRFPFPIPSPFMRHSQFSERSHEGVGEKERWQSASRCASHAAPRNRVRYLLWVSMHAVSQSDRISSAACIQLTHTISFFFVFLTGPVPCSFVFIGACQETKNKKKLRKLARRLIFDQGIEIPALRAPSVGQLPISSYATRFFFISQSPGPIMIATLWCTACSPGLRN